MIHINVEIILTTINYFKQTFSHFILLSYRSFKLSLRVFTPMKVVVVNMFLAPWIFPIGTYLLFGLGSQWKKSLFKKIGFRGNFQEPNLLWWKYNLIFRNQCPRFTFILNQMGASSLIQINTPSCQMKIHNYTAKCCNLFSPTKSLWQEIIYND